MLLELDFSAKSNRSPANLFRFNLEVNNIIFKIKLHTVAHDLKKPNFFDDRRTVELVHIFQITQRILF